MATSTTIAGNVFIRVDGQLLPNIDGKGTVKNPTGKEFEGVMGPDGAIGKKAKSVAIEVESTFAHISDLDIASIQSDETEVTLTLEWDNGATYTLSNAWANISEAGNGEVKITWGGTSGTFGKA